MNGVPNEIEFHQQMSPPIPQQHPNVATYANADGGSVHPGSVAHGSFTQGQGPLMYAGGHAPAPHLITGAVGAGQPMYGNPMYGGFNPMMHGGAPMMSYQGGQTMGQGMGVMPLQQHQMMNGQASVMMGQGIGAMNGHAAPR